MKLETTSNKKLYISSLYITRKIFDSKYMYTYSKIYQHFFYIIS